MHRSPSVQKAAKRTRNPFSEKAEVLNQFSPKKPKNKEAGEKNSLPTARQNFEEGKRGNKVTEITFW